MLDYHIHYHAHGEVGPYEVARIEEIVAAARAAGVVEIGISEHVFRFREFVDVVGEWWLDTDDSEELKRHCAHYFRDHATQSVREYLDVLHDAAARGLPVKVGLEVDHYPGRMREVAAFLQDLPLDYVLGSVHWIGAWGFDNEEVIEEWDRRNVDTVYRQYFDSLVELLESGVPDVLAHPDVVKKFGHRPRAFGLDDAWERIVTACKSAGVTIEVSTAGLRMPVAELYPAPELLEGAVEKGAHVVTASDAHVPELVGYRFDYLREVLQRAGASGSVGFERRAAVVHRLFE